MACSAEERELAPGRFGRDMEWVRGVEDGTYQKVARRHSIRARRMIASSAAEEHLCREEVRPLVVHHRAHLERLAGRYDLKWNLEGVANSTSGIVPEETIGSRDGIRIGQEDPARSGRCRGPPWEVREANLLRYWGGGCHHGPRGGDPLPHALRERGISAMVAGPTLRALGELSLLAFLALEGNADGHLSSSRGPQARDPT